MIAIPIPEGLQVPQEPQFELPVIFEIEGDQLIALAVDGIPLEYAESDEVAEEGGGEEGGEGDFAAAVEQAMGGMQ
jgi:hypothetical protein